MPEEYTTKKGAKITVSFRRDDGNARFLVCSYSKEATARKAKSFRLKKKALRIVTQTVKVGAIFALMLGIVVAHEFISLRMFVLAALIIVLTIEQYIEDQLQLDESSSTERFSIPKITVHIDATPSGTNTPKADENPRRSKLMAPQSAAEASFVLSEEDLQPDMYFWEILESLRTERGYSIREELVVLNTEKLLAEIKRARSAKTSSIPWGDIVTDDDVALAVWQRLRTYPQPNF